MVKRFFSLVVSLIVCQAVVEPGFSQEFGKIPTGADKFAKIAYDALGNIDMEEGTVELWVRNDFQIKKQAEYPHYFPMVYFTLYNGPGKRDPISIITRFVNGAGDLYSTVGKAAGSVKLAKLNWQEKGEWHYLALTWKYENRTMTRKLYLDGKLVNTRFMEQELNVLNNGAQIVIGAYYFNCCFGVVDELRISAVARTEEELKESPGKNFIWDDYTLLLDHFDKVKPDQIKKWQGTTETEKGKTGNITGSYEIFDGKFGKAVKLHVIEEKSRKEK